MKTLNKHVKKPSLDYSRQTQGGDAPCCWDDSELALRFEIERPEDLEAHWDPDNPRDEKVLLDRQTKLRWIGRFTD